MLIRMIFSTSKNNDFGIDFVIDSSIINVNPLSWKYFSSRIKRNMSVVTVEKIILIK